MHRWRTVLIVLALAGVSCRTTAPHPAAAPNVPIAAGPVKADQRDIWLRQFARGYFPGRSGQLFMVSREGEFTVDRNPLYAFMHGSPWPYDTHIPLLLYGPPFIKTLVWNERVSQQDVAPTLAALLGTAPP